MPDWKGLMLIFSIHNQIGKDHAHNKYIKWFMEKAMPILSISYTLYAYHAYNSYNILNMVVAFSMKHFIY